MAEALPQPAAPESRRAPERRFGLPMLTTSAEGKSDKVAAGKPNLREGLIFRGGDDCTFGLLGMADNPDGILCFGACLDGVSQGGRGDEASITAARSLRQNLTQALLLATQSHSRDEIEMIVANLIAKANQEVWARREQLGHRHMATTLSLFALQETPEGQLYLHSWNTGDSLTMVYVQLADGREFLYPVIVPDDIVGRAMRGQAGLRAEHEDAQLLIRSHDPNQPMTVEKQQAVYQQALVKIFGGSAGPAIEHAIGFSRKAVVNYQRVDLPVPGGQFKDGVVTQVKVAAMSDGIERYSKFEEQLAAMRRSGPGQAAQALMGLGHKADADDRSAVVAEVRLSAEKALAGVAAAVADLENIESLPGKTLPERTEKAKRAARAGQQTRVYFGQLPENIKQQVLGRIAADLVPGAVSITEADLFRLIDYRLAHPPT